MECVNTVTSVLYAEARGESEKGMRGVLHVILNRAKKQHKPACHVVKQRGQFAKGLYKPGDPIWQLAKTLVKNPGRDITKGAVYFHNRSVKPYWIRELKVTLKYGGHVFYSA
jgi:spore germination cell wall hydrolase CwlJ-like protein